MSLNPTLRQSLTAVEGARMRVAIYVPRTILSRNLYAPTTLTIDLGRVFSLGERMTRARSAQIYSFDCK